MTKKVTYVIDLPVLNWPERKFPRNEFEKLELLLDRGYNTIQLKKVDLDIIRFLAENGPNSCYSMYKGPIKPRKRGRPPDEKKWNKLKRNKTKALGYKRKKILRHASKLVEKGLLRQIKPKRKEVFALTFNGFHISIPKQDLNAEYLNTVIKSNSNLLPFAKYWNAIVEIAGENIAVQSVYEALLQQIYRKPTKIEKISLEFDSFLVEPRPVFPEIGEKKHNREFADYLSINLELRDSYISFLAVHDILSLTLEKKWSVIGSILSNLESEKALAFFEKRNIQNNSLFIPGTRLKEFFPKFAAIEYFFTGMLMGKLLWKEGESKKILLKNSI